MFVVHGVGKMILKAIQKYITKWVIFHGLGIGSLVCALFLGTWVFLDIIFTGYFIGAESRLPIALIELGIMIYGIHYFIYIIRNFITKDAMR